MSSVQILSGVGYIATYEGARYTVSQYNPTNAVKSFAAGAAAALVSQTIIVPFDVISQHLMVLGLVSQQSQPQKKVITNHPNNRTPQFRVGKVIKNSLLRNFN